MVAPSGELSGRGCSKCSGVGDSITQEANQVTLITAVFLAKQANIVPDKLRAALRKSQANGATDLSWHHHRERWQADDRTEVDRLESMKRVLREIGY